MPIFKWNLIWHAIKEMTTLCSDKRRLFNQSEVHCSPKLSWVHAIYSCSACFSTQNSSTRLSVWIWIQRFDPSPSMTLKMKHDGTPKCMNFSRGITFIFLKDCMYRWYSFNNKIQHLFSFHSFVDLYCSNNFFNIYYRAFLWKLAISHHLSIRAEFASFLRQECGIPCNRE